MFKELKLSFVFQAFNFSAIMPSFVVGRDGKIRDIIILRGIGGGCDEEAIRVIKSMPKWIPGKQDSRLVSCRFTLSFTF